MFFKILDFRFLIFDKNFSMRKLLLFFCLINFSFITAQQNPKNIYKADSIIVKSYDFKGIKPLFNQHNDVTYIINFWATWCAPCIKELPHFEKIGVQYANQDVKVILISLDFSKNVEQKLISFIKRKNIKSEVYHLDDPDANTWINAISSEWSGAIPATLIYNTKTRKFYEQSFTFDQLEQEVLTFIN